MNADGSNPHIVQSEIKLAVNVKWSPQGNALAFAGELEGKEGIWIFDRVTRQLARVWPDIEAYDWSSDGRRMVVISHTEQNGTEFVHPVMFDVRMGTK
jgi:Tol biopolymer transport system component